MILDDNSITNCFCYVTLNTTSVFSIISSKILTAVIQSAAYS